MNLKVPKKSSESFLFTFKKTWKGKKLWKIWKMLDKIVKACYSAPGLILT